MLTYLCIKEQGLDSRGGKRMISIAFEGTTCSSERTYLVARNQDKPSATYYLGVICKMNSGGGDEYAHDLSIPRLSWDGIKLQTTL
jgi:hypothetical protein